MKFDFKKLMITLLVCFLPAIMVAAESGAVDGQKPATPLQPAQQAATAPVLKPSEPQQITPPAAVATPLTPPEPFKLQPLVPAANNIKLQAIPESPKPQPIILIGYVDLAKISTDSEPGKAGQTKLINQKKKLQAQIEAKRKQLDKQRAEIEAKLSSLTQDQREAKSNEFRKKIDEFQKFGQKSENELQKMQMELSNSLYEKIQKATNTYAKINSLTLVAVKREILYQSAGVVPQDITDEVIKLVNEEGRKK